MEVKNLHIPDLISELMYEHDCVIIPGFGGLVARHVPAHASEDSLFFPPSKSVLFNRNLINNDGLLANRIMERAGLSYEKANLLIQDFVSENLATLHQHRRLEWNPIGFFYFNAENILQFEPQADVNYLIDSFGLGTVMVKPLISLAEEEKPVFEDRRARTEAVPAKKRNYLRIAAIAIGAPLVATALFIIGTQTPAMKDTAFANLSFFSAKPEAGFKEVKRDRSDFPFEAISTKEFTDANGILHLPLSHKKLTHVLINPNDTSAIDHTAVSSKLHKAEQTIKYFNTRGMYQIVIGCFSQEENAMRLVNSLEGRNIKAAVIGKNQKGMTVVSAGGYDDMSSAREAIESIRNQFPAAWILNKKSL